MTTATDSASTPGRILIVDDDPVVAGMLGAFLSDDGHTVSEADSGAAALSALAGLDATALPELVILDIDMPGMDGYETCRRLRESDATRDLPVIFLSGRDDLDSRLRAYDAGGSDFMTKPYEADVILRKVALGIRHTRRQRAAAAARQVSSAEAMETAAQLGESGVLLAYHRSALGCSTQLALAKLTVETMASFGLDCHVQLRAPNETVTQTRNGPASPLEESVIEKSQAMDRIFSFSKRLVINFDTVSLLVMNMPVADVAFCGRIRDHAALIGEAAQLAVKNIDLRTKAVARADELRQLADSSRVAVEELRDGYRELQTATRVELETVTNRIEGMYYGLGLTSDQELQISSTVRIAVERILTLLKRGNEFDQNFLVIVDSLTKAGECNVTLEEEAPPAIEFW